MEIHKSIFCICEVFMMKLQFMLMSGETSSPIRIVKNEFKINFCTSVCFTFAGLFLLHTLYDLLL